MEMMGDMPLLQGKDKVYGNRQGCRICGTQKNFLPGNGDDPAGRSGELPM